MESQWSVFYPGNYSNPATDTDETLYMRIKRSCTRFSERTALEYGATKLSYAMLLDKIDELGEPDSTIIIQQYYYNRTTLEIGKAISMTAAAVQKRSIRARKRLRSMLTEIGVSI